jgi:hypothetical protein
MANQEQVEILKQGVEAWNKWREKNPSIKIDLSYTDFRTANLSESDPFKADLLKPNPWFIDPIGANLFSFDFRRANLSKADLRRANLRRANLSRADLFGADLLEANLIRADLFESNLNDAYLKGAYLTGADLAGANLVGAILNKTNLKDANLFQANLIGAMLWGAIVENTIFGDTNLGETAGLEDVIHQSSSSVDTHTLQRSKGKIPAAFLRGCGLSDFEIETAKLYNPDLSNQEINDILYKIYDLRARQAIQVSPLFISYSHADTAFVDRLDVMLNEKGIRFWRDTHDAKAGRLEKQIEQAIRHNPTVLVVLSKNSTRSDWVEHEVRTARGLAKELKRDVLCPVALDESWKSSPWPERVMEQVMEYNILDFSKWEDEKVFGQMFVKLLEGLQLFYKK